MEIGKIAHKGLKRFVERGDPSGLPPAAIDKITRMVRFLDRMASPDELKALTFWKAHVLTGDRKGVWSFFVTKNWRLTFEIKDGRIETLTLEDYR